MILITGSVHVSVRLPQLRWRESEASFGDTSHGASAVGESRLETTHLSFLCAHDPTSSLLRRIAMNQWGIQLKSLMHDIATEDAESG